uniref:Two pore calcium channel protein 1 n=2 Tax=Cacopsylla melanoneura TaxID=428564 RepID=A0A8D8TKZ2_9HEMI
MTLRSPQLNSEGYVRFSDDLLQVPIALQDAPTLNHQIEPGGGGGGDHNQNDVIGSRSSFYDHAHHRNGTDVVELSPSSGQGQTNDFLPWEMNYHEAAIFLEEGANNDKFDSHPGHPGALPAYLLVHNDWYYGLDLATSLILLSLALGEEPAVRAFRLPVAVHSTIELLALLVIGVELTLKLRWIGWGSVLKHKRTMLKCLTLAVMFIEAFIVLVRQSSHFRVTRSLRPIFIVDTRYLGGVRRFIRQIFQSLPPIFDMLLLIFFFVSIYAILGFFIFSSNPNDTHFATLFDSFVSMFVLLTTANFPDVMMPAYSLSKWNSLFFISFLCIVLYILMNLMLAVVYETFTTIERNKFRKLLLHKRKATQHAFKLLTTLQNPDQVKFQQFAGLMRYYAPDKGPRDVVLMFAYLNTSRSGSLSMNEMYRVYDAVMMTWQPQYSHIPWYHNTHESIQTVCTRLHEAINWPYFEHIVYALIMCNGFAMVYRATQPYPTLQESAFSFCASWDAVFFAVVFSIEALVKLAALGSQYFESGWNFYDFLVTYGSLLSIFVMYTNPTFYYVVVLRPLRLLRLFKMKKRYRDIIGTLALLSPLIRSAGVVMLVLYYFFAIIGMELFAQYDMKNCCNGTSVEDFYKYTGRSTSNESASATSGYYYLNTFANLAVSYVTLFELTVVNNWFIVMNGYAAVVTSFTRVYFIMFYLLTMVVLTIVVASVLEAFRFRIQYKRQTSKRDEEKLLHEEVDLKWDEIQSWIQDFQLLEKLRNDLVVGGIATFVGRRPRNREVLQRRMYRSEIDQWMNDANELESNHQDPAD